MRKCWWANLNVFGDIKFIKKFLCYKILNLKCRRNFYPLGQAYKGVIATMWSIKDRYAPQFAEDFYKNLIKGGDSFSGERAAHAIHHAAQNLRQKLALEKSDLERSLLV